MVTLQSKLNEIEKLESQQIKNNLRNRFMHLMHISLKETLATKDLIFYFLILYLSTGILIYCIRIPELFNMKISVIKQLKSSPNNCITNEVKFK